MNKQDEQELEDFEKTLHQKHYWMIIGGSMLIVVLGIVFFYTVFSMISGAITSFFGG